jgi:bla regulator protein blaR1
MIPALGNHLWQSTLFAGAAGLLTLALRNNSARVRYWLWLAASLKFLLPFSLLIGIGAHIGWQTPSFTNLPQQVWIVGQSFLVAATLPRGVFFANRAVIEAAPAWSATPLLAAIWACGFCAALWRWRTRWLRIRAARRAAYPIRIDSSVPVLASPASFEPGVFGIFRPVLLLPEGIAERLTPEQFAAIVAHEMNHVRSRDNLTSALHLVVEAVFWFYPLVWWLSARLVTERERACDEAVCGQGCHPAIYAEAILDICKFYLESPLACAAGVTGADLKQRIEQIMAQRTARELAFGKKLLLGCAGVAAIALPVAIGMLNAPAGHAQTDERPKVAVASVKPSKEDRFIGVRAYPGGRVSGSGPVQFFIGNAYALPAYGISGGPAWVYSDRYSIEATPERDPGPGRRLTLLQQVLEDRFQLKYHQETRELALYTLTAAKGGPRLPAAADTNCVPVTPGDPTPPPLPDPNLPFRAPCGRVIAQYSPYGLRMLGNKVSMQEFARFLSSVMGRAVVDKTGFQGTFDADLQLIPDQAVAGLPPLPLPPSPPGAPAPAVDPAGLSVFTALQQQLGLKLESGKGPVEVMVIDHLEKPSEN